MTTEELFLNEGAFYTAANQLAYHHTIVGDMGEDGLVLNDAGKKIHATLADITDVQAKPAARKKNKPQVQAETQEDGVTDEPADSGADEKAIDALLAE